jgi:hypothetical protein
MKNQKKYCKDCKHHWTKGIKDGIHDNWCCMTGQPAKKIIGHCINLGLKVGIKQ